MEDRIRQKAKDFGVSPKDAEIFLSFFRDRSSLFDVNDSYAEELSQDKERMLCFRNSLAEDGFEFTPDEFKNVVAFVCYMKSLIKGSA